MPTVQELSELGGWARARTQLTSEPPARHKTVTKVCLGENESPDQELADLERMEPRFVPILTFDGVDWTGPFVYPPKRVGDHHRRWEVSSGRFPQRPRSSRSPDIRLRLLD